MSASWFQFPGDPRISTILICTLHICFEIAAYVLVVMVIKYYIPGRTHGNMIFGKLTGILAGVFAARFFTFSLTEYFPLDETATSGVLFVFIVLNSLLTSVMYDRDFGGSHGPDLSNP